MIFKKRRRVIASIDGYLPVPQAQLGPQRQILQEQPGLLLSFLIAVFMIFVFIVIV